MTPGNRSRNQGASQYSGSRVLHLFEGGRGAFGIRVLNTLPPSWKAKLVQVEPLYDLEYFKVVTATIILDLEGLRWEELVTDDLFANFDKATALAPKLTKWLSQINGVRITDEGKTLNSYLVRWSARYDVGKARGVFTATMTPTKGDSTLLTLDLVEWLCF